MPRKSRITFDRDATVVEVSDGGSMDETSSTSDAMSVFKAPMRPEIGKTIPVVDVLENMAGYMMPNFRFANTNEKGTCLICGLETSMSTRKLCGECMKEAGEKIYNLVREAIENGEKEVTI